ncbi:MAG: hypothetical protein ACRC5M_00170, partial [Anaeroplasmataceae bacterium]
PEEKAAYEKEKEEYEESKKVGVNMEDAEGNEYVLEHSISDVDKLSKPVYIYGSKTPRGAINSLVMFNYLRDDKSIESLDQLDKRFLYVNAFGDIIMDDNTVVVPAAANATYYSDEKGTVYNPNTPAFMNYYPKTSLNNEYFSVSERDAGKYIMSSYGEYDNNSIGPSITNSTTTDSRKISKNKKGFSSLQMQDKTMPIDVSMFNGGSDKIDTMRSIDYKFKWGITSLGSGSGNAITNSRTLVPDTSALVHFDTPDGLFPLTGNMSDPNYVQKAKYIALRMYESMSINEEGTYCNLNKRYDIDYLSDMFREGAKGSQSISAFVKNSINDYNDLDKSGFITRTVREWAQKVLDTIGQSTGVIGVKNAYQDPILGKFLYYSKEFKSLIFVLIALFFVIKFNRGRVNAVYAIVATAGCLVISYLLIVIIPVQLPVVINGVMNNVSDDLAYRALFMKEEKYSNPFGEKAGLDSNGTFNLGTSSLNLYRLYPEDITEICRVMDLDESEVMSGTSVVLDGDSGLFIQGDLIKINTDRLMSSLSITGSYDKESVSNGYKIESKKYLSNAIDYYSPFYTIVDSFIGKLNKFSELYNIPPNPLSYPGGMTKDSFLVSNYIKSDLFLNGSSIEALRTQFSDEHYELALSKFGDNNLDFLGLKEAYVDSVEQNYDIVKDTLWYQTMERQGYYEGFGLVKDEELMARLISQVNKVVKVFLIKIEDQVAYISDENLIRITSLYAMTEANRIVSNIDDNLYPQALNFEELKLEDVLLPILTKEYDKYMAQNQNIVNYIESDFGLMGLWLFMAICIQSWIITNSMLYGLPILYLLLLLCLVIRLSISSKNSTVRTTITGYMRVFGALCLCYMGFCFSTIFAYRFNDSTWTMFFLMVIYSLFVTIIYTVLSTLLMSKFDLGSANVNASLSKFTDKFKLNSIVANARNSIQNLRHRRNITQYDNSKNSNYLHNKYSYKNGNNNLYGSEGRSSRVNYNSNKKRTNYNPWSRNSKYNDSRNPRNKKDYDYDDYDDYDEDDEDSLFNKYRHRR